MKIGFIGVGKMGRALLEGVLRSKLVSPADILAFDAHAPALESVREATGAGVAASNAQIAAETEVLILSVKPQHAEAAVRELASVDSPPRLLVSIAAGLATARLETWCNSRHRVIRVMPNTPALIGAGASAFCLGTSATDEDAALVERIFGSTGLVRRVAESQMDAVTGLSGSGPAYAYAMIEALADGAVCEGLPKPLALELAAQTLAGAARMVLETGEHPAVLRDQVTSPGGTTIAGLAALENRAFRAALIDAVRTAARRSRELGES